MTVPDLVMAAVILAGALYLLYRSFSRKEGPCHGCGSAGACRARAERAAEPVRLRPPRRDVTRRQVER